MTATAPHRVGARDAGRALPRYQLAPGTLDEVARRLYRERYAERWAPLLDRHADAVATRSAQMVA